MKQKQITEEEIDRQVKTLIEEFDKLQEFYVKKSCDLLSQIYDLRKEQNPKYSISDLENEKGLEKHKEKIRPLWRYSNVTDKIKEYQLKGKLSNMDVFYIANAPHSIRQNMDKVADMLVNKEIRVEELNESNEYFLLKKLGGNTMDAELKILLLTAYQFPVIKDRIIKNKEFLQTPSNRKLLKERFDELKKVIEEVMREE